MNKKLDEKPDEKDKGKVTDTKEITQKKLDEKKQEKTIQKDTLEKVYITFHSTHIILNIYPTTL